MTRFAALGVAVAALATVYVAACVLPGEPSGAARIQFTLDPAPPYRVPLAGVVEPAITIAADGQVLKSPSYKLETLDADVVRVDSTARRLLGVMRATTAVRVTYLGATGTPDTVFPVQVVVSRVAVDSAGLTFTRLGVRTRLSAVAFDANDATVPNVPFTWSSATPTVATVNDTGLVTAVDEGATTITAEADGVAGASDVTVTQVAAAVRVAPELDTVRTVGRSIQLVALAYDANNNVLFTAKPHWTSSDTTVARVDGAGRATAIGAGKSRIVARVGAAADTATLVVAQVVRFLVVTPGFDTLTAIADTARIAALALDSLSFPIPSPTVSWTTSDMTIATVEPTGLVRAVRNGAVLLTASAAGQSAFATIVVQQRVAVAQLSTHSVALVGEGDTVRLSAVGVDKNGYRVADASFQWGSANTCVASVDREGGLVTALGGGEAAIIAYAYAPWHYGERPDTAVASVTGAPAGEPTIAYASIEGIKAFCSVGGARTVLIRAETNGDYPDSLYEFWSPAWSPDGARLAFYGRSYSLICGLYIARADGSEVQQISDRCSDHLAWSPDGMRLAFSPANTDTIYVMNSDGSNVRPLFAFGPGRRVDGLTWSPGGTKLAFAGFWAETRCIFVMNADGSGAVCLGETQGGGDPAWSPDGSQLAVGSSKDIWVINPDGSGATNLTQGNGAFASARAPAWSPDGSRLVFEGWVEGYDLHPELFVINRDGTGLQHLDTGGWASSPTWRRVAPPAGARSLTGARRGLER